MFADFDVANELLDDIRAMGWKLPSPIQAKAIPPALEGRDIVGMAQTGTGKTGAFVIPIIELLGWREREGARKGVPHAVVLVPTRELALQVEEQVRILTKSSPLRGRSALIIGGAPMPPQIRDLKKAEIVIATPGRLIDHMQRGTVDLSDVDILVLDEADRMFDMGFEPQVRRIMRVVPGDAQVLLFSATLDDTLTSLANSALNDPMRIEIGPKKTPPSTINQVVYYMHQGSKVKPLIGHIQRHSGKVLIFTRTKVGCDRVANALDREGIDTVRLHADRTQKQRQQALKAFKDGRARILVATDVASRGLDVPDVELVVNYDFPKVTDDYVHRIGRTARAGANGEAISFVEPFDLPVLRDVEKVIGRNIARIDEHGTVIDENPTALRDDNLVSGMTRKRKLSRGW